MMKVWLLVKNWRNKFPDITDGYESMIFTTKDSLEYHLNNLPKKYNSIIKEIDLPEQAVCYMQMKSEFERRIPNEVKHE